MLHRPSAKNAHGIAWRKCAEVDGVVGRLLPGGKRGHGLLGGAAGSLLPRGIGSQEGGFDLGLLWLVEKRRDPQRLGQVTAHQDVAAGRTAGMTVDA
jgi:hypothetical protein